jgi:hypothetical protein
MPGLVPGIHVFLLAVTKDVDGRAFAAPKGLRPRRRDKPGHDEGGEAAVQFTAFTEKGGLYVIPLTQRLQRGCDNRPVGEVGIGFFSDL